MNDQTLGRRDFIKGAVAGDELSPKGTDIGINVYIDRARTV